MPPALEVYIALGSNLEGPARQVRAGLSRLAALADARLLAYSRLYRTAPLGPPEQPEYINAVARMLTRLPPLDLLDGLQAIERLHGRRRDGERWGPRTLDLDMLLYGGQRIDSPRLRVPHPELPRRAFVLLPLADVAPADLDIPGQGSLSRLLEVCPPHRMTPLGVAHTPL